MKKAFSTSVERRGWIANFGGPDQVKATLGELESDAAAYYHGAINEDELLADISQATEDLMRTYRQTTGKPGVRFDRIPTIVRAARNSRSQDEARETSRPRLNAAGIDVGGLVD